MGKKSFKKNIFMLALSFIILVISFFLMKYLFSIDNTFSKYIGCILNIIFDISLDIFGFIFIIDIVFFLDYIKTNSKEKYKKDK